MEVPISAYDEVGGMCYFPRMLHKIRLHAAGNLREDFHENLGEALDAKCCRFLRVSYEDVKTRTLEGLSYAEVLDWCFRHGRELDDVDLLVWNAFIRKLGWNDHVTETLARRKAESGLGDRDEIATMSEYFEYDEGRKR